MHQSEIDFYEFLDAIKKRPGMYLGNEYTLWSLHLLIYGYGTGSNGLYKTKMNANNFSRFSLWLNGYIKNASPNSMGWWGLIQERATSVDHAFELFSMYLEQFKFDKEIRESQNIKSQILDRSFLNDKKVKCIIEKKIDRLDKVKYENSKSLWAEYFHKKELVASNSYFSEKEWKNNIEVNIDNECRVERRSE